MTRPSYMIVQNLAVVAALDICSGAGLKVGVHKAWGVMQDHGVKLRQCR